MTGVLAAALALTLAQQQVDTTFDVRAGGTLDVETHGGSVTVRAWDRDAVRIRAPQLDRAGLGVRHDADGVRVETESRFGRRMAAVAYEISVPRRYNVSIEGVNIVVVVDGVQGDVEIDNIEGAISVRGTAGELSIESVSGGITITNARGPVEVSTVNQNIRLDGVRGRIAAETVNGSIVIRATDSNDVHASTVNGLIDYDGAVRDGGRYYLGAHNGRITMSLAEAVNASVTVSTNSGRVETAFPVSIRETSGRNVSFTLGTGSARVELQSFNGTVHLVRPGGR